MSFKRRNTSSPEPDDSEPDNVPPAKRQRPSPEEESNDDDDDGFEHPVGREQPRSDPTYGQKGAFPGLDDGNDELFYGPPSDGIEYLRMVRSEAKGVPHLLVAPKPKPEGDLPEEREVEGEDVEDNDCGYYADGAYTAAPMSGVPTSASDTVAPDAQDVYYDSLSTRFNLLRATLKCTPPLSAIEVLDELHAISLPSDSRKAKQHWRDLLQTTEPHPVQLACMDSESALEVVKLLKGMMTQTVKSKDDDRIRRFGAWSWSVLGRCPDRTELGSEEIAELRALGKSAVGLSVRNRNKPRRSRDSGQPDHPESEAAEGRSGEVEEDNEAESALEKAKRRLQGALQDSEAVPKGHAEVTDDEEAEEGEVETEDADRQVNKEIRIILDMIITIVGEVYGQRDLLESRDIWTEDGEV